MKLLSLIAFVCLQLSIFACSTDAYAYHLNSDTGSIEHHHNPIDGDSNPIDYPCQIHAAHAFVVLGADVAMDYQASSETVFSLQGIRIFGLLYSINHPPIA